MARLKPVKQDPTILINLVKEFGVSVKDAADAFGRARSVLLEFGASAEKLKMNLEVEDDRNGQA